MASLPEAPPLIHLAAIYRLAQGAQATTVTYYFPVERFGFPATLTRSSGSPWHPDNLDDARYRLVESFRDWLETNHPIVRSGILTGKVGALTRFP
jgi:hypothetical protein